MSLRVVAFLAVAVLAASGCAGKAPAGTLKMLDYKPPIAGSIVATYQPFANPNPTGVVPTAGTMTQCAQNDVNNPVPMGGNPQDQAVPRCKGPYSTFEAHAALPAPSAGGYKVYAIGPSYELEVMTLKGSGGSFSGSANVTTQDISGKVQELQLRMDGVTVATAPGTAGNHTLAPALGALLVTGSFTGRHLELTIHGLPGNGTFMGKLYVADPASPTGYTAKEEFEVHGGKTAYDSKDHNIADFAQFHIHVGNSMVNLYKAAIEAT